MGSPSPPPTSVLGHAFRSLQVRDYRNYWFSGLGMTGVQGIAQFSLPWLILELTDRVGQLGLVIFLQGVAWSFVALIGGVLADRYSRRSLLIATQLFTFLSLSLLAGLALTELVEVWHVYLTSLVFGASQALTMPARMAILRSLVNEDLMMNAVALNATQQHAARALWPASAGLLIGLLGVGAALLAAGSCSLFAVLFLLRLKGLREESDESPGHPVRQAQEGLRYAFSSPVLRMVMLVNFSVAFFGLAYLHVGPGFGKEVLNLDAAEAGLFIMAAGLGSIIGSMGLILIEIRDKNSLVVLATAGFGLSLLALSVNPWVPVAFLLMVLFGFSNATLSVTAQTIMQIASSPRYLGRVVSLWTLGGGIGALTALPIGLVGDAVGLRWSLGFVAAILVVLSVYLAVVHVPIARRHSPPQLAPVSTNS